MYSYSHTLTIFTKHSMLAFKEVCYGPPQSYGFTERIILSAWWCYSDRLTDLVVCCTQLQFDVLKETEFDVGIEVSSTSRSTTLLPCHSRSRMKSRQQDGRPDENPSNQSGIQPEPTARLECVLLRRTQQYPQSYKINEKSKIIE